MADFAVRVVKIVEPVEDHPDADRLSIIRVLGFVCISAKLEDGSHRYKQGDLVVYVPEGAIVPEYLLRRGFWNDEKNMGILAGSQGNRVKTLKLRGLVSQGIIFPCYNIMNKGCTPDWWVPGAAGITSEPYIKVEDGQDVGEFLGITKYEPPVPASLSGEVCNIHGKTHRYDFESIQTLPDLFEIGEEVVVTEKLHGTFCTVSYIPDLNHPDLLFDGNLYVGSKGLSGQGLVLKDNEANANNTYMKIAKELLETGFGEKIKALSEEFLAPVRVFGEVYGAGLQKGFNYGTNKHAFAVFDIQVGWEFVPYNQMIELAERLGVTTVPLLYIGPYDLEKLVEFRDGRAVLSDQTLREGIVIKARDGGRHPHHGRKIGKWVSPQYLLKATGEEIN